ncbi:MAG: ABC transporter ATP-binding protein [bacterium]|nr:ABC transporter ATP-binding protein [bacterium]
MAGQPIGSGDTIVFDNVSKFYGEVLGINRVTLTFEPAITAPAEPDGAAKTARVKLTSGPLPPTQGTIRVLGTEPYRPERMFSQVGYCTQFDSFPSGMSGYQFIYSYLRVHGFPHREAYDLTWQALERVGLTDAAKRRVAGYSKGMRQRVRLAQAISHQPRVLVLDEPLNGLDPMARAEIIDIFQELAATGSLLIISSHILHEVDMISDRVVLLSSGYVVAEGEIGGVRSETMDEHPIQVLVRCDKPAVVASRLFEQDHVVEATLHDDRQGLEVRTRDADRFYSLLGDIVLQENVKIDTVTVADADVRAVSQHLLGNEGEAR